jgi:hypothetical protein
LKPRPDIALQNALKRVRGYSAINRLQPVSLRCQPPISIGGVPTVTIALAVVETTA